MKIGLVIGRFQVPLLHDRHQAILNSTRDAYDRVAVMLGVSPLDGREARHPLLFQQRASLIEAHFADSSKYAGVFPLFDRHDDTVWSAQIDTFCKMMWPDDLVTLVGGPAPDSFIPHYKGKLPTFVRDYKGFSVSGTEMRKMMRPLNSYDFLAGQTYALEQQYPRVYPVVDIAVFDDDNILLIKRADTGEWALPGGFVDPVDESLVMAAKRELREEVGVNLEVSEPVFIGSAQVPDWRYRGSRDRIMTCLHACKRLWGRPDVSSEVSEWSWFTEMRSLREVADIHKPLVEAVYEDRWKRGLPA